ncbi:MAG: histidine kinase [Muribaculaceae bacterium]|nr:histidine kinase [Muribaculaceae bacterium]
MRALHLPLLKERRAETFVYVWIWLGAFGLYLLDIMRIRAQLSEPLVDGAVVMRIVANLLPFFLLFLVNNYLLIPRYLLRNRLRAYFSVTALAVVLLWGWQYYSFVGSGHVPPHPHPQPEVRPLMPLPLFLDFTYALLVIGANMAVALMFRRFDDKLERESLMKSHAESRLAYLKAQINPHFYMNMLNNIHGMIDIDPERAQAMVIDMSNLMRYTLYDSSEPRIPLTEEVAFLRNYLRLMRQRFPENRVEIRTQFPDETEMRGISLPPLLFLVFIENAFKHGVSYRDRSFVKVKMAIEADVLTFSCVNTDHSVADKGREGIGLQNISQRLNLLYGVRDVLKIEKADGVYTVILKIPLGDETADVDNR